MQPPCPNCETPLASSSVGFLCTNCGKAYRYTDPDPELDPLAPTPPANHHNYASSHTADQTGSDYADHESFRSPTASPKPDELPSQLAPEPDFQSAQIINHHWTSHASQRDRHRQPQHDHSSSDYNSAATHQSDDSLSSPAPRLYPVTAPIDHEAPAKAPSEADPNWPTPDGHRTTDAGETPSAQEYEPTAHDTEPDADEAASYGPHKPSPHILDVTGAADNQAYTPHSPLTDRHDYVEQVHELDDTPELLPSFVDTHGLEPTPGTPSTTTQPLPTTAQQLDDKSAALARAEALLASASTPSTEARSNKNLYLIVGTIVALIIMSVAAFTILKPPTSSTTVSVSPSASSPSVAPTNTQSAAGKRDTQRKDDLNALSVALAAYQKATGSYPVGSDISALTPLTTATPPYIKAISLDPQSDEANGVVIRYGYTSDGKTFTLTATLENKNDPDGKNGLYIVKSPSAN